MLASKRLFAMLAVAAAITIAGCGGSSSSGTSAASYVKSVCSAIAPFETDIEGGSASLASSAKKGIEERKTVLHTFLVKVSDDLERMVTQLKAAGTPNVSNGKKIAGGLVDAVTEIHGTVSKTASQAATLPTSDPKTFNTAYETLVNGLASSMNQIGSSFGNLKSPTLQAAAQKDSTCRALSSTGG